MADNGREAGVVDLELLPSADPGDGGSHVVMDTPPRRPAQNA